MTGLTPESLALLIAATLNAGTVVALASLGLLINERAGVLNLGAEGMMLVAGTQPLRRRSQRLCRHHLHPAEAARAAAFRHSRSG